MTAEELVEVWPEKWPRPDPYTTKNSASQLKHFARFFGTVPLTEITRSDFRRFAMAHPGAARYARTALADAFDEGILEKNVAATVRVKLPPKKKIQIPSPAEVGMLALCAQRFDPHFAAMIEVCAACGLREGEARALSFYDIEQGQGTARVEYSINREERLKEPKNAASKASFALLGTSPSALAMVMGYMAGAPETPLRPRRLFPYSRNEVSAKWRKARYEAKLDNVKFHALRHFCATDLLNRGASVDDVALQLRCTAQEIRKTYGHPDRDAALERLRAL